MEEVVQLHELEQSLIKCIKILVDEGQNDDYTMVALDTYSRVLQRILTAQK